MKGTLQRWSTLSLLLFLCFPASQGFGTPKDVPYRVFILHSYEENHVCGQPQHDGVVAALKKAGFQDKDTLDIQVYFMDSKRHNNTPELIKEQARIALEKIRAFRPDVLVTLDDNAFQAVALPLVDTPVAIIFSGLNGQPEDYNQDTTFLRSRVQPAHNVTGVYEKLHIVDAMRVHSRLFTDFKKLRVYVDPSLTGQAIAKQVQLEMASEGEPNTWELKLVDSWEAYQQEIQAVNADAAVSAIYPAALVLKDRAGKTYTAPEIFAWTVQHSQKPEIALNFAFTHMGLFGGAAVDFHAMGVQAGAMVARILQGEDVGNIAIEDAQRYALVFNMERAKQLGITIPSDILMAADEVMMGKR